MKNATLFLPSPKSADVISLCKLGFRHVGVHARCEIVWKSMAFPRAHDESLQIIHLSNGYFPTEAIQNHKMRCQCFHPMVKTSNATSENAIKENFCGRLISSDLGEREAELKMFASYRSLGLAFLFRLGDKLLQKLVV